VIFIYVSVGDLIMVRLNKTRKAVPGIILKQFSAQKTQTFEVLVMGESWVVSPKDIVRIDD
jgi:co-chaperonin GroES (HSP10)